MDYNEVVGPDGLVIRVGANDDHRICAECGRDCEPDFAEEAEGLGARNAFICPEHGIHSVIDPFEHLR